MPAYCLCQVLNRDRQAQCITRLHLGTFQVYVLGLCLGLMFAGDKQQRTEHKV